MVGLLHQKRSKTCFKALLQRVDGGLNGFRVGIAAGASVDRCDHHSMAGQFQTLLEPFWQLLEPFRAVADRRTGLAERKRVAQRPKCGSLSVAFGEADQQRARSKRFSYIAKLRRKRRIHVLAFGDVKLDVVRHRWEWRAIDKTSRQERYARLLRVHGESAQSYMLNIRQTGPSARKQREASSSYLSCAIKASASSIAFPS